MLSVLHFATMHMCAIQQLKYSTVSINLRHTCIIINFYIYYHLQELNTDCCWNKETHIPSFSKTWRSSSSIMMLISLRCVWSSAHRPCSVEQTNTQRSYLHFHLTNKWHAHVDPCREQTCSNGNSADKVLYWPCSISTWHSSSRMRISLMAFLFAAEDRSAIMLQNLHGNRSIISPI